MSPSQSDDETAPASRASTVRRLYADNRQDYEGKQGEYVIFSWSCISISIYYYSNKKCNYCIIQIKINYKWIRVTKNSCTDTQCWNAWNYTVLKVICGQVWCPKFGICALHLTHPKCTHTAVNTHLEQWAAIYAAAPMEQLRVRCLAQGHLSRGIEGGESAVHSLPPPTIPPRPRLKPAPQPLGYESDSLTIRPRLPQPMVWPAMV